MKRKYPLSFFLFGMVMNFLFHYFYLFLPGLILCIIGIWNLPCLLIGIAVLGLDLLLSFIEQLEIRKGSLSESDNPKYNEFMDACFGTDSKGIMDLLKQRMQETEAEDERRTAILEGLVVYRQLREAVQNGMTLDEMIDAFAGMCKTSVGEEDDLLFETGTFPFTGEKLFYFSLVRQFRFFTDTDEYVQLHLNVLYTPSPKTRLLRKTYWSSLEEGDFFEIVKSSTAYRTVRDMPYVKIDIRIEET